MNTQFSLFDAPAEQCTLRNVSGRNYRCTRKPRSNEDFGEWQFEYNGKWHKVLNYTIRRELNKIAGYYAR